MVRVRLGERGGWLRPPVYSCRWREVREHLALDATASEGGGDEGCLYVWEVGDQPFLLLSAGRVWGVGFTGSCANPQVMLGTHQQQHECLVSVTAGRLRLAVYSCK